MLGQDQHGLAMVYGIHTVQSIKERLTNRLDMIQQLHLSITLILLELEP